MDAAAVVSLFTFLKEPIKTANDLVATAKIQMYEVLRHRAEETMGAANVLIGVRDADNYPA